MSEQLAPLSPLASHSLLWGVLIAGAIIAYAACMWLERRTAARCTRGCCCPAHDADLGLDLSAYDKAHT